MNEEILWLGWTGLHVTAWKLIGYTGALMFGGRWLVNGSGRGILSIQLHPAQRAYVMGVPVRLRELLVSVHEPSSLAAALGAAA